MGFDKSLFQLIRHPLKVRRLSVTRSVRLTPEVQRVTFSGPDLAGFVTLAPEDHVKVFFPKAGAEEPVVPSFGPLGVVLPSFGEKPIGRDYTLVRHDPAAQELEIDFFLHGHGVASSWAQQAAPGSVLGVAGPRGSYVLNREFDWQLFVGDETALPGMARRIRELPGRTAALAVLLVNGPAEEQALTAAGPLHVRWVHRPGPGADATELLLSALQELSLPSGDGYAWVTGEAGESQRVYRYLVQARGLLKAHVHASGNWKRGVTNHDHHEEITL